MTFHLQHFIFCMWTLLHVVLCCGLAEQCDVRGQEDWQLFDMRDWCPITDWVHRPARGRW